jgi:hypothetical protein
VSLLISILGSGLIAAAFAANQTGSTGKVVAPLSGGERSCSLALLASALLDSQRGF